MVNQFVYMTNHFVDGEIVSTTSCCVRYDVVSMRTDYLKFGLFILTP